LLQRLRAKEKQQESGGDRPTPKTKLQDASLMKSTDIRIDDIAFTYEDFRYRTPIKFGGVASDRVTILNVACAVSTRDGKHARGFGSMPMGNIWSFPSKALGYDQTLAAMKAVVERVAGVYRGCTEVGHPIDLTWALEPEYVKAAAAVDVGEPVPVLCTLVCASSFDAALHDAFGKVHGLNCYLTYHPSFMNHDLGHYLGVRFRGDTLHRYVQRNPQPRMPLYHLIGALDPLEEKHVTKRIGDGLPETLPEWIEHDGLTHLKIKLNGDDLEWDIQRVLDVERVTFATQRRRGVNRWHYSLDFNERCANVDYLVEFLRRVRAPSPEAFGRIQYIEQPTARDLKANRRNRMHAASKIRPVVIDESLIDLESLLMAQEMGYTGAALKACKGQTQSLILAAAAQKLGMFLCVQDLTCPGASLIHSAGLAAHITGVAAIESNARQYCPAANEPWRARFPGIFTVKDGTIETGVLTGVGLGAVAADA
jgi:L-alanine-DL-glutamate epimerase-like enolase superfamily enzyme